MDVYECWRSGQGEMQLNKQYNKHTNITHCMCCISSFANKQADFGVLYQAQPSQKKIYFIFLLKTAKQKYMDCYLLSIRQENEKKDKKRKVGVESLFPSLEETKTEQEKRVFSSKRDKSVCAECSKKQLEQLCCWQHIDVGFWSLLWS